MSDDAQPKTLWRRFIGQPPLWQGILWTTLGLLRIGLAISDPSTVWRWVFGGIWLTLGVIVLVSAISDYQHSRGRYAIKNDGESPTVEEEDWRR
jgi:hypothetical protein